MNQVPLFPAQEAYRHELLVDGRESLAHVMVFPDLNLAGFVYPSVRAGGHAKGRSLFFGPALEAAIEEEGESIVPPDMNFDRWSAGGLSMAIVEPHRVVDLRWDGQRIQFEGRFEALHPVYAFSSHPSGVPAYYGDDRTEQHGRITGLLTLDGRQIAVDGYMIRDHSWGPRVWGLNQHYKWIHATTADCSVHFFEMQSFGRNYLNGYVFRDGTISHLVSVDYTFEYDDDMIQQVFHATFVDQLGRQVRIACESFAKYRYELDPKVYLNYGAVSVDIDGSKGSGWLEFAWNREYHDFAKQYVTRFG